MDQSSPRIIESEEPSGMDTAMPGPLGQPKIMIVDDMPDNLRLLHALLTESGYAVRSFPSGPMALRAAARVPPDLILLDIRMPGMDGYEVCRILKADESLQDIPVLFLSAFGNLEDKVPAFEAGGADFVSKPFQSAEVLARVRVHLRNRVLERSLRLRNQEIMEHQAQLEVRLGQAEKMNSLSRISAGVAHEILNPLGIIALSLEMLRDRPELPATVHAELGVCSQQVQRIVAISDSLRQFSHAGGNERGPEDLNALIINLLQLYASQMAIEGVDVLVNLSPALPLLSLNAKRIEQVLINLFSNALSAMEGMRHKVLTLRTDLITEGGVEYVRITVADRGAGINKRDMPRIFDPFFTTKEQGKGTGMGLSIAHGIIQEHGGTIRVQAAVREGTVFLIDLPMDGNPSSEFPSGGRGGTKPECGSTAPDT